MTDYNNSETLTGHPKIIPCIQPKKKKDYTLPKRNWKNTMAMPWRRSCQGKQPK